MKWHHTGGQLLTLSNLQLSSDLFYISPLATEHHPCIRGGIPVLFPQFGELGLCSKHGFARQSKWQSIDENTQNIILASQDNWQGQAELTLHYQLNDQQSNQQQLHSVLTIKNIGTESFEFTGGLHPYFAFDDITQISIQGLNDISFHDRYGYQQSVDTPFLTGQAFERLYLATPNITIKSPEKTLHLSCKGYTGLMVWNSGLELATGMTDLPDEDWQKFICVEPVIAPEPIKLDPQQTQIFEFTLSYH